VEQIDTFIAQWHERAKIMSAFLLCRHHLRRAKA
jgi:hypothetical protein